MSGLTREQVEAARDCFAGEGVHCDGCSCMDGEHVCCQPDYASVAAALLEAWDDLAAEHKVSAWLASRVIERTTTLAGGKVMSVEQRLVCATEEQAANHLAAARKAVSK